MGRILKELIIAIPLGLAICIGLYILAMNSSGLQVRGVVVDGDQIASLDTTTIRAFSTGYDNIYAVDLDDVGKSTCEVLKSHSVTLRRRIDMKIGMSVEAEHPVLWVNSDRLLALSSSGRILAPSNVDNNSDFPVLVGLHDLTLKDGQFCRDIQILYAVGFLNELEHKNNDFKKMVSTIRVDSIYGIVITLIPKEIAVALGFSDFELRISKLKSVIDYLNQLEQTPALADVRHADVVQVTYPDNEGAQVEAK